MKGSDRPTGALRLPCWAALAAILVGCINWNFDPQITVTSPNGGEEYLAGSALTIAWNCSHVDKVRIELSRDGGATWETLADSASTPPRTFTWTVSGPASDNCRVRVSDADGKAQDESDAAFSISSPPPWTTVLSPNGGEYWLADGTETVNWSTTGTVGDVMIELSTNNGAEWSTLVPSTADDGTESVNVPDTPSAQCLIRVSELDGSPADTSDAVFEIGPAYIRITAPSAGEKWPVGSSQQITWESGGVQDVRIVLHYNVGSYSEEIVAFTGAAAGAYPWTVTGPVWGQCTMQVSEATGGTPSDYFYPFTISGIAVISPNGGEVLATEGSCNVSWTAPGVEGNVEIHYSTDSGASYPDLVATVPATDRAFAWTIPAETSTQCRVRVQEEGGVGFSDESDADFAIGAGVGNWAPMSIAGAPGPGRVAFWTGTEVLVWADDAGALYDPGSDTWRPMNTTGAPPFRYDASMICTGTELIIWGGYTYEGFPLILTHHWNAGSIYDIGADTWSDMNTTGAPTGRSSHSAVWTGSDMIVWGGFWSDWTTGEWLDTGGIYDVSGDSWTAMETSGAAPGRAQHTAVWTGTEMIVWGGQGVGGYLDTGGRYDPGSDSWTAATTTNAPAGRVCHSAVWADSEMIVWGGIYDDGIKRALLNTGGRYDPAGDSWTAMPTSGGPTAREYHTAAWTGTMMIIWGGTDSLNQTGNLATETNTGAIYIPVLDSWAGTGCTNAPAPRRSHGAVWTGSKMIVWGGWYMDGGVISGYIDGGIYTP